VIYVPNKEMDVHQVLVIGVLLWFDVFPIHQCVQVVQIKFSVFVQFRIFQDVFGVQSVDHVKSKTKKEVQHVLVIQMKTVNIVWEVVIGVKKTINVKKLDVHLVQQGRNAQDLVRLVVESV
jgi:hypothetical protein